MSILTSDCMELLIFWLNFWSIINITFCSLSSWRPTLMLTEINIRHQLSHLRILLLRHDLWNSTLFAAESSCAWEFSVFKWMPGFLKVNLRLLHWWKWAINWRLHYSQPFYRCLDDTKQIQRTSLHTCRRGLNENRNVVTSNKHNCEWWNADKNSTPLFEITINDIRFWLQVAKRICFYVNEESVP